MKSEEEVRKELDEMITCMEYAIKYGSSNIDYYEGQCVALEWVLK